MKDLAIIILTGMVAGLLFTTGYFAIEASNNKTKFVPYIKVTSKSSKDRIERFFNNRTTVKKVFSEYIWKKNGTYVSEQDVFISYGLDKPEQQREFRLQYAKQGAKRYLHICGNLQAIDESWSLGYCVDQPAKIQDVQG